MRCWLLKVPGCLYSWLKKYFPRIWFAGGGFKHFLFSPLGKWSNLTNFFEMGWNRQLDSVLFHPQKSKTERNKLFCSLLSYYRLPEGWLTGKPPYLFFSWGTLLGNLKSFRCTKLSGPRWSGENPPWTTPPWTSIFSIGDPLNWWPLRYSSFWTEPGVLENPLKTGSESFRKKFPKYLRVSNPRNTPWELKDYQPPWPY